MLQRSRSSVFIVIIGIVPALLGGPVFAAVFAAIMIAAFYEFISMCGIGETQAARIGYLSILFFASVALLSENPATVHGALAFAIFAPLASSLVEPVDANRLSEWSLAVAATMMFGVPTYAAINLRGSEGLSSQSWINDIADVANPDNTLTGIGLAWFLFALLVIWVTDTFAYLVGKQIGRTRLIPHISPNKTVEGAIGGLTAAAVTGGLCVSLFGMDIGVAAGFGLGAAVAIAGMVGDLIQSMIKRQVGVKDSGSLIPGHGGVYDRVDGLILGLLVVWIASPLIG